jgi:hypothetical protein
MPEWIDAPTEIATIMAIGASVVGVLFWIVRTKVNEVLYETKPNSGTSLRDAVDRIETHMLRVEEKIDGHITWHLNRESK